MDIKGEYRIEAPREKVFAALNDPEVLKACIPGCESLEKLSDTEMTAKVRLRSIQVDWAYAVATIWANRAKIAIERAGGLRRQLAKATTSSAVSNDDRTNSMRQCGSALTGWPSWNLSLRYASRSPQVPPTVPSWRAFQCWSKASTML